ncbi:NACHT domain-containing protein [bacterium]|nr:NACHT domain-containing protein [bacterium]MBU1959550.1 NACHT domain-containing protein [bacterium]
MTDNQKAQARVFFENRILKSDKQAFEDLFTEIMNYKELDFRSIKPWGNIGDRKNDGYIESRGIFYQVYAPEDIRKSYPDVIKKIKTDFNGLIEQWSNVREFYFVVNDKYKGVNPDSEQLLKQIKEDNNLVEAKFITAKDLENILFTLNNDQIIKITGVTFLDSTILTSATLKNTYLKKFDTISLLTTNIPKPIDKIFINLAIIKDKKEDKENNKLISREVFLSSYEEIHKPKEPIKIKDLIDTSKKSLIYGKAGIGKTTLCKYIAYRWAKEELYQEFEYVVYIPLREWENDGIKGAIQDYYYSRDSEKLTIDIASTKMLFLFDGYDELDSDRKKLLRVEIDKYALTHYVITTRPYGYQKNDFRVDEQFETIGFTDENVDNYIDNFFDEDNQKSQSLKNYLQSNISIKHIAYIPLMLEMICSLWEKEEFTNSLTMTELYSKVIEDMLNKYSASKDDERVFKRKNRKKIKEYLGKIAFEGLIKQKILFDGYLIEDAVEDIDFFEENVIYSGFLKSDVKEKDLLDNYFEFPHLTFQEYFSALYVSNLSQEEQSEIIRDWKFYPHMQMFFAFLGGLIKDKEFLLGEIESEPRDLVEVYTLNLLITAIQEFLNKNGLFKKYQIRIINFLKGNSNIWTKGLIVNSLLYKVQNINIKNLLIEVLKDKDLNTNPNIFILKSKIFTYLPNYNMSKEDSEYWQKSLSFSEAIKLAEDKGYFSSPIENAEYYLAKLYLEEFENHRCVIKEDIESFFIQLEGVVQEKQEFLEVKNYFIKNDIKKFPLNLNTENEEFIDFVITLFKLKNHFWNRITIHYLLSLNRCDNKIIDGVFYFIIECIDPRVQEKSLNSLIVFVNKNFTAFERLYQITNDSKFNYFLFKLNIKTLFRAYDENYQIFFYIKEHCQNNNKPLYIRNNKLHTIENGKEISTQREVDEETLNKINMLLKGDDLDD